MDLEVVSFAQSFFSFFSMERMFESLSMVLSSVPAVLTSPLEGSVLLLETLCVRWGMLNVFA